MHDAALGLFRRVAEGTLGLLVTPIVVAELVYVTRSLFSWSPAVAAVRLAAMLQADGVALTDPSTTLHALRLLAERPRLDFADAWLAAAALEVGPAVIASFDRDFDGVPGIQRLST